MLSSGWSGFSLESFSERCDAYFGCTNYNWYHRHPQIPQFFCSLGNIYQFVFALLHFYSLACWKSKIDDMASSFFFLFINTMSGLMVEIRWSVFISKSYTHISCLLTLGPDFWSELGDTFPSQNPIRIFSGILTLALVFWSGLSDPFVYQNPIAIFSCLLTLGLVFWSGLGDPFVCQNPIPIFLVY